MLNARKLIMVLVLSVIAVFAPTIFAHYVDEKQLPIIIDTDAGLDDSIAILYLLNQAPHRIKAIIVDGNGVAHLQSGLANMGYLIAKTKNNNINLTAGSKISLIYHHHYPGWLRSMADNLFLLNPGDLKNPNTYLSAQHLLSDLLVEQNNSYIVICLGPLTNLAQFLKLHPKARQHIHHIYIMGGAIHVPGNVRSVLPKVKNKVAEWNFYIDPLAAKIVFQSGVPITLIPLDVTNTLPLTQNFVSRLSTARRHGVLAFLINALNENSATIKQRLYEFWDPLTAVIALNQDIYSYEKLPLTVLLKPSMISGRLVIKANANKISVVDHVNCKIFKNKLISGLMKHNSNV